MRSSLSALVVAVAVEKAALPILLQLAVFANVPREPLPTRPLLPLLRTPPRPF
jgi:hypothetical protein